MKKIVVCALVLLSLTGCNKNLPMEQSNTVTILGTYTWDVETNHQGGGKNTDFWWERIDNTKGILLAQNGTTVEKVNDNFESINKNYIVQLPAFKGRSINHKDIIRGTVAVFKTGDGHYGKLRIKGYRALHDFGFKEAREYLSPEWREFVLRKPNTQKYHLVIEYVLYR